MIELIVTPSRVIMVDVVGEFQGTPAQAELTEYPIETGARRSDHKIVGQAELNLEILQTETPIDDPEYAMQSVDLPKLAPRTRVTSLSLLAEQGASAGVSAIAGALFGAKEPPRMQVYAARTPRDRGGELQDQLVELCNSDELATVTYRGRTYQNMSLLSVGISYPSAGHTSFMCTFRELQMTSIERVGLPDPAALSLKPKAKIGAAASADTEDAGISKGKSLLLSGIEAFF